LCSEHEQIVRAIYAAANAGDMDAALAFADPDVEWIPAEGSPFEKAYRGRERVRRFLEQEWAGVFDDLHIEVRQVIGAPNDVVVALVHLTGRGGVSGVELAIDIAHLWRFRNGVVVQGCAYSQPDKARAAAGLEDQPSTN
jgi:ketosteroid isomerase-like protein